MNSIAFGLRRARHVTLYHLQSTRLYRRLGRRLRPQVEVSIATADERRAVQAWLSGQRADQLAGADFPGSTIFVAKHRGEIVGAVHIVQYPDTTPVFRGYWGSSLQVKQQWRGMGVATALADTGNAWASAQGARTMHLMVRESNIPAINLYLKRGWRRMADPQVNAWCLQNPLPGGEHSIPMEHDL